MVEWLNKMSDCDSQDQWASFTKIFFRKFVLEKGLKKSLHQIHDIFLNRRIVCTFVVVMMNPFFLVN